MTVQTNTNVASFLGNGAATYPIGFKFNSAADLVVQKTVIATGVTTKLTLNSDYSVAGAGVEEGGSITFSQAPTSAESIKVTRVVDLLQLTDLRNQGKFYAEVHEEVFDKLVMIDQQQQTEIDDANAKSDEAVAIANEANAKSDQAVAKAAQNLVDMQAQYDAFEQGASLVVIGDYAAGLVVDGYNKVFRKDGEFYRAAAGLALPYTTSGIWAGESASFVSVGDAALRQDVFDSILPDKGAGILGYGYGVAYPANSVGRALNVLMSSRRISVKEYGALGDNLTDDTAAIQACFDYCSSVGAKAYFPQGTYVISSTVTLFENLAAQEPLGGSTKSCIEGDGSGLSVIRWTGGNAPAIMIDGEVISLQTVRGIGILGNSTGTGLYLKNLAWFHAEDLMVTGFEFGIDAYSVLSSNFTSCVIRSNKFGARLQRDLGAYISNPNAVSFTDCDIGLNSEWGLYVLRPGVFNVRGGAIQGNGIGGVNPERWGLRAIDAGAEGASGINLDGVYFEANEGLADVFIEQVNYSGPTTIVGCGFTRIPGNYTTHCVRVDNAAIVNTSLSMLGNGFLSASGYVPDASRKYLYVQDPTTGFELVELGSTYSSATETHSIPGRHVTRAAVLAAGVEFDGVAVSPVRYINIASVTRTGVGVYDVLFDSPMADSSYISTPAIIGGAGFIYITGKTASGFTVNTLGFSGAPSDHKWSVSVFG